MCNTALLWLVLIVTVTITVHGKKTDRNQPHPHGALLKPYNPTNPFQGVSLSRKDESLLLDGKPVTKQTMPSKDDIASGAAGGSAICVQDVQAPPCAVWNQILDLNSYQKKVSKVNESRNYFVKKLGHGITNIKTKMVLGVLPGYAVCMCLCMFVCIIFTIMMILLALCFYSNLCCLPPFVSNVKCFLDLLSA
jgi:hypothetical protein